LPVLIRARLVFGRLKSASQNGLNAEHLEEVVRDGSAVNATVPAGLGKLNNALPFDRWLTMNLEAQQFRSILFYAISKSLWFIEIRRSTARTRTVRRAVLIAVFFYREWDHDLFQAAADRARRRVENLGPVLGQSGLGRHFASELIGICRAPMLLQSHGKLLPG